MSIQQKQNKQTNEQNINWFLSRVSDLLFLTSLRVADLIS